jgi:hypothetical protein
MTALTILDAVQECSGLVVLVELPGGERRWVRPPELGLSREQAEQMIEDAGVTVAGRMGS